MAGPFEIDTKGGIQKPDFVKWKFGAEGENFQLSAGISDIREGFFFELNANTKKAVTITSDSLAGFMKKAANEGIKLKDPAGLISSMTTEAAKLVPDVNLMAISEITGVATVYNGASEARGVAVGLVKEGFRWFGSTIATKYGVVDFRIGIHHTSSKYRLKLSGAGWPVSIDVIVTCSGQKDSGSYNHWSCKYWRDSRKLCVKGNRWHRFMMDHCRFHCQCF